MITSLCRPIVFGALLALTTFITDARAQGMDTCSPGEISDALNQLQCRIDGGVVSATTIATTVSAVCDETFTPESCHNCFRRIGFKAALSMKVLVKLQTLPRTALFDLRAELADAEDTVCSAKEDPFWNDLPDGLNSGDGNSDSTQKAPRPSSGRSGRPPHK